jgi:hypothetical protein
MTIKIIKIFLFFLIALLINSEMVLADDKSTSTDKGNEPFLSDIYKQDKEPSPSGVSAQSNETDSKGNSEYDQPFSAGIGDTVVAYVRNIEELVLPAKCMEKNNTDGQTKWVPITGCEKKNIVLAVNGVFISERKPDDIPLEVGDKDKNGRIVFKLDYIKDDKNGNKDKWAALLGSPDFNNFFDKPLSTVRIGTVDGKLFDSNPKLTEKFKLRRIKSVQFVISSAVLAIALVYFFWWTDKNFLREPALAEDGKRPYSLAKCQMAFWFFLSITSFLFLWVITGAMDTITPEVLTLMGLSAVTALGSAWIGNSADSDSEERIKDLNQTINRLEVERIELQGKIDQIVTDTPDKTTLQNIVKATNERLVAMRQQIATLREIPVTKGFLTDIMNDGANPSFHRFQMVIWTVALGVIFVYLVWEKLAMPEFGSTLLALQGISAGTYLGFKFPKQQ